MATTARIISLLAILATILPCLLYFADVIQHDAVKWIMLAGTTVWFVATPLWMGRKLPVDASEVEV